MPIKVKLTGPLNSIVNKILTDFSKTEEFTKLYLRIKNRNITINNASKSSAPYSSLKFEPHYFNGVIYIPDEEYRYYSTKMPSDYINQFSSIQDDNAYWKKVKDFEDNYPNHYRLSLQRVIFHELLHCFQDGYNIGTAYTINPGAFEKPVIEKTNFFMDKYYNEPHRKGHDYEGTYKADDKKWFYH